MARNTTRWFERFTVGQRVEVRSFQGGNGPECWSAGTVTSLPTRSRRPGVTVGWFRVSVDPRPGLNTVPVEFEVGSGRSVRPFTG